MDCGTRCMECIPCTTPTACDSLTAGSTTVRRWTTARCCSMPRRAQACSGSCMSLITHPSLDSPYPYFSGKAEVEQYLTGTGVPSAIVRPAILFGGDGVLVNNVAWLLRRLPVFAIGGRGDYRVRGIH